MVKAVKRVRRPSSFLAKGCLSYGVNLTPCERQPSGWQPSAKPRPERDATSPSPRAIGRSCRPPATTSCTGTGRRAAGPALRRDAALRRNPAARRGEVINYVRAMNHGLARLPELPVSMRLIREIHAELMRGVRGGRLQSGELRTSQNWIGPAGEARRAQRDNRLCAEPALSLRALHRSVHLTHAPQEIRPLFLPLGLLR